MKKILFSFVIVVLAGFVSVSAQRTKNDPVLLQIGDRTITRSEFEAIYRKNNLEMEVVDPKTVEEYLELFINFNLKVQEAITLGMDTNPAFLKELQTYREQLSRPYFNDEEVAEGLLKEAYERLLYDIRASHIMFAVDRDAAPSDTLAAYNKAIEIRKRILEGESFEELAKTYSDDSNAKDTPATAATPMRPGNAGDLGYFTALNMVYPFENADYQTPVGQISKPVRSDFGYHIIKVTDRLPAMGVARVAHIMVMTPHESSGEEMLEFERRIHEIYEKVLDGEDFGELAYRHSEDRNSASRNGEMPAFTSSRMVPEFIKAISKLENPGDISQPLQSRFGWHIIKLLEKTPVGSYEDMYADLKTRVSRDNRALLSKQVVIDRLKKEYKLKENRSNLKPFYSMVDESIFSARWEFAEEADLTKTLFRFGSNSYTQTDFGAYLESSQAHRTPKDIKMYVDKMFDTFVEDRLIAYEDSQLETKYPAFKNLMREYHDGILLFELTDEKVWSKAMVDTTGLREFYQNNLENYMWDKRLHATVYSFSNIDDALSAGLHLKEHEDSAPGMDISDHGKDLHGREGKFSMGDNEIIDKIDWKTGTSEPIYHNDKYYVVHVHEVLPPQPKAKSEIRGILISDYQNYLEKMWVDELRQKYEVYVDFDVLKQIKL